MWPQLASINEMVRKNCRTPLKLTSRGIPQASSFPPLQPMLSYYSSNHPSFHVSGVRLAMFKMKPRYIARIILSILSHSHLFGFRRSPVLSFFLTPLATLGGEGAGPVVDGGGSWFGQLGNLLRCQRIQQAAFWGSSLPVRLGSSFGGNLSKSKGPITIKRNQLHRLAFI